MTDTTNDFVRSREETARMLNMSTRTLHRLEKAGKAPRMTRITERVIGYRDSSIREFLDAKTALA